MFFKDYLSLDFLSKVITGRVIFPSETFRGTYSIRCG